MDRYTGEIMSGDPRSGYRARFPNDGGNYPMNQECAEEGERQWEAHNMPDFGINIVRPDRTVRAYIL